MLVSSLNCRFVASVNCVIAAVSLWVAESPLLAALANSVSSARTCFAARRAQSTPDSALYFSYKAHASCSDDGSLSLT